MRQAPPYSIMRASLLSKWWNWWSWPWIRTQAYLKWLLSACCLDQYYRLDHSVSSNFDTLSSGEFLADSVVSRCDAQGVTWRVSSCPWIVLSLSASWLPLGETFLLPGPPAMLFLPWSQTTTSQKKLLLLGVVSAAYFVPVSGERLTGSCSLFPLEMSRSQWGWQSMLCPLSQSHTHIDMCPGVQDSPLLFLSWSIRSFTFLASLFSEHFLM